VSPAWPGGVRDATRGRRRGRGGTATVRKRDRHGPSPGREPPGQAAQVAEERGAGVSQSGGLAGEASRVASPRRRRFFRSRKPLPGRPPAAGHPAGHSTIDGWVVPVSAAPVSLPRRPSASAPLRRRRVGVRNPIGLKYSSTHKHTPCGLSSSGKVCKIIRDYRRLSAGRSP
jgi:hypothetical protein